MFDKIVANADVVTKLTFAGMAAISFLAIIAGGFFGIKPLPEVFEITKAIIYVSVGIGVGAGTTAVATRAAMRTHAAAQKKPK